MGCETRKEGAFRSEIRHRSWGADDLVINGHPVVFRPSVGLQRRRDTATNLRQSTRLGLRADKYA
jgi:hypothetical protein